MSSSKKELLRFGTVVLLSGVLSSCFFNKKVTREFPSDVSEANKAMMESAIQSPLSSGAKLVIAESSTGTGLGKFYIASNLPDLSLIYVIVKSKENPDNIYKYSAPLINHLAHFLNPKSAGDQPLAGKYMVMAVDALSENQVNTEAKAALDALPKTTETVDPLFVDLNRKVYAQKEIDL